MGLAKSAMKKNVPVKCWMQQRSRLTLYDSESEEIREGRKPAICFQNPTNGQKRITIHLEMK